MAWVFETQKKNPIKTYSALRYARRVIARVNKEEENEEGNNRKKMTVKIKVSVLRQNRENQSDPEARLGDVPQDLSHL